MKIINRIRDILGLPLKHPESPAETAEYAVGQVWKYQTRPGEEDSLLVIVAITPMPNGESAFSIFVEGVKIKNPLTKSGVQNYLPHAPISKEALERSVTGLIGTRPRLPDYKDAFGEWKAAFDSGQGGVFTVTVSEIVSFVETAVAQAT